MKSIIYLICFTEQPYYEIIILFRTQLTIPSRISTIITKSVVSERTTSLLPHKSRQTPTLHRSATEKKTTLIFTTGQARQFSLQFYPAYLLLYSGRGSERGNRQIHCGLRNTKHHKGQRIFNFTQVIGMPGLAIPCVCVCDLMAVCCSPRNSSATSLAWLTIQTS